MDWYICPNNNLFNDYGFNKMSACRVIDLKKLTKIDSVNINTPTFVRTDNVHGITNLNPTQRLILSLRFYYSSTFGQNFEDVFDLSEE
jgi:hypothetical protein